MNYRTWRLLRDAGHRLERRFGRSVAAPVTRLRRRTARVLPAALTAVQYPGIRGRVHLDDQMMGKDDLATQRHYARVGREAVDLVVEALSAAGRTLADAEACLDLPSGYGRVTRLLAATIPASRITVADVDREAVRFCRREFGVQGFVIGTDARALRLRRQYDVIFVGSLLTHLSSDFARAAGTSIRTSSRSTVQADAQRAAGSGSTIGVPVAAFVPTWTATP